MDDFERNVREQARQRIARLFKAKADSLAMEAVFGEDLKASFVSDFKANEFDLLDNDIKDVADRRLLRDLSSGALVIRTVGDYCDHMVRCYGIKPKDVARVLQFEPT